MTRRASLALAALTLLPLAIACGKKDAAPIVEPESGAVQLAGKFVFEPTLGTTYYHTMTRTEDFQIIGSPIHNTEEWTARWAMSITPETNLYLYRAELQSLRIVINGAAMLEGPEVANKGAFMELLIDPNGRIVDVRRTETLTQALVDVSPPEAKAQMSQMFHPQSLRMMFAARAAERTEDLVGQSAAVGAKWGGIVQAPDGSAPMARRVEVLSKEDCGEVSCVKVERELTIDRGLVWEGASQRVENFVTQQGGDPATVELLEAEVTLLDHMVVDPRTMEFHGARFEKSATMRVRGPQGALTVKNSTIRTSAYEY